MGESGNPHDISTSSCVYVVTAISILLNLFQNYPIPNHSLNNFHRWESGNPVRGPNMCVYLDSTIKKLKTGSCATFAFSFYFTYSDFFLLSACFNLLRLISSYLLFISVSVF